VPRRQLRAERGAAMYQCRLTFLILSRGDDLQRQLQAIAPLPRFSHGFSTALPPGGDALAQADVVVLDAADADEVGQTLALLEKTGKSGAKLIVCAEKSVSQALSADVLARLSALWTAPLTETELRFHFAGLQETFRLEKELWLTQNWLDTTIDSIPSLIWYKDTRGAHLKVNDFFCRTVGKTPEQIEGRGHCVVWDIPPEEYAKGEYTCQESDIEVMDRGECCVFDEKVKTRDGMKQFRTYKSPLFDLDGSIMGTVGVAEDVTDLRNLDISLGILIESLPFAMLVCDLDRRVVRLNGEFVSAFRLSAQQMAEVPYDEWKRQTFADVRRQKNGKWLEATLVRGGRDRTFEIREAEIRDMFGKPSGYFCLFIDVTAQKRAEKQIIRSANTDFLTGLYNRRYLCGYAAAHKKEPFALLYLDLDDFKTVNDRFGHQQGDAALILTAEELRRSFPDGLISRVGGDEFVVVWRGEHSEEEMQKKVDDFLAQLRTVCRRDVQFTGLSASAGYALTSGDESLDALIAQSDAAMYQMKKQKKEQT